MKFVLVAEEPQGNAEATIRVAIIAATSQSRTEPQISSPAVLLQVSHFLRIRALLCYFKIVFRMQKFQSPVVLIVHGLSVSLQPLLPYAATDKYNNGTPCAPSCCLWAYLDWVWGIYSGPNFPKIGEGRLEATANCAAYALRTAIDKGVVSQAAVDAWKTAETNAQCRETCLS